MPDKGSVSEEQQSQAGLGDETLRAAAFLAGDGVGSFLTARCGDARNSPPCPRPKSIAAGTLAFLKQALKLKKAANEPQAYLVFGKGEEVAILAESGGGQTEDEKGEMVLAKGAKGAKVLLAKQQIAMQLRFLLFPFDERRDVDDVCGEVEG